LFFFSLLSLLLLLTCSLSSTVSPFILSSHPISVFPFLFLFLSLPPF
jgi:hypothetical protein